MSYLSALNTELTTDPKAIGYSASLNISDIAVAGLINSTTSAGAAAVTLPSISHDDLATLIADVVLNLSAATTALQSQWTPMLTMIGGISTFQTSSQNLNMLNTLSADFPTYLTAAQITAATTRMGSRAEILWGVGFSVAWQDVARAMGRM